MASCSFSELKRENQTAQSKYSNLCVGKFSWNTVKKVRRCTTAMVWCLWNCNTQQSTTQINGQPLLFRIWAWKLNNTMEIYQSKCGWIFVELGLIFEAKYYCNGLGGWGLANATTHHWNVRFAALFVIPSPKIRLHWDNISIYAWANFCDMMMSNQGDIDNHWQGINRH